MFDQFETADGSPVELLIFQNGSDIFRRSNTVRQIVVDGQTYLPLVYDGSPFTQSKDSDDSDIRMTVPNDFEVVTLYDGPLTSNKTLVTIQRFHIDDPDEQVLVSWKGRIASVQHSEDDVKLLIRPTTAGFGSTPPDVFSGQCNVELFESPGCNLTRDDFRHVGTIGSITNNGIHLTIPGLRAQAAALDAANGGPTGPLNSGELDIYWQGGHIVLGNGEIRDVVEGNVGGDPDAIRINVIFRSVAVLNGASIFAGCDYTLSTCHRKFNNAINHQGYAYIPKIDPANTELPQGNRTSGSSFAGVQP